LSDCSETNLLKKARIAARWHSKVVTDARKDNLSVAEY